MDTEKAQQVLDELKGVRPEYLNEDAKRLFEAIMTIADERDMYRRQVNDAFDRGWIHKDKIREKIKQCENEMKKCPREIVVHGIEMKIDTYKKLLEE